MGMGNGELLANHSSEPVQQTSPAFQPFLLPNLHQALCQPGSLCCVYIVSTCINLLPAQPMSTNRPYAIVAVFPGHKPKIISRTHNRSDAEDIVRFLQHRVPNATFYMIFEPESESAESEDNEL